MASVGVAGKQVNQQAVTHHEESDQTVKVSGKMIMRIPMKEIFLHMTVETVSIGHQLPGDIVGHHDKHPA